MAFAIFNLGDAPFESAPGLKRTDKKLEEVIAAGGGPRQTARVVLVEIPYRMYAWPLVQMTDAQRDALQAFFDARGITTGAFLIRDTEDPKEVELTLEPAVGDGVLVTFALPTDDTLEGYRFFAKPGTIVGLVNGAAATVASADLDARTITFAAPPGGGLSVKARFTPLRLVRLSKPFDVTEIDVGEHKGGLELEEIWRD